MLERDKGDFVLRKLSAEAIGTFWLVFCGCGSAVLAAGFPELGIGFAGVALAFGLTVLTMVYAVGGISGGHFNPAVSLGLAIGGRFAWGELIPYWIAQVVGGFVGAAVLYLIASGKAGLGAPAASPRTATAPIRPAATGCSRPSDRAGADRGLPDRDPRRDVREGAGRLRAASPSASR